MIDGYLMTCGGRDASGYITSKLYGNTQQKISGIFHLSTISYSFISDNCFSLQEGRWVKKADMLKPLNGLGASPFPGTPNSLMVSKDKGTETLKSGAKSWIYGPDFPGDNLYLHCQATLGPSIVITGR